MTITYADYKELPGSPVEDADANTGKRTLTRTFTCDWLNRYLVEDFLFSGSNRICSYHTQLYAMRCHKEPMFSNDPPTPEDPDFLTTDRVIYQKAKLVVTYESLIGSQKSGSADAGNVTGCDFCSEEIDLEVQYLSQSATALYWDTNQEDPIQEGQSPEIMIPYRNYMVTYHNVKTIPTTFDTLAGSVNDDTYTFEEHGFDLAAETLLYKGFRSSRATTTFGTAGWDLSLTFSKICFSGATWNKFYNPDTGDFQAIYDSGGLQCKPFTPVDWSDLAQPATP